MQKLVNEINPVGSTADLSGRQFAVIVSRYNGMITEKLLEGAVETLRDHQVAEQRIDVVRVPGAWELSLAAKQLAASGRYAGLVCLGAVIRGETTHDRHINRVVSQSIGELSLQYNLPIAFGLLTCNTFEQAHERAGGKVGNKGQEATQAMLEMAHLTELTDRL